MTTEEEILNFFFSQWPILYFLIEYPYYPMFSLFYPILSLSPYFLGNKKQNFSFMANPTTPKYSEKKKKALKHAWNHSEKSYKVFKNL